MSKFNANVSGATKTSSYEGGTVYKKNAVEDWLNFLFSSYMEDRFYETSSHQMSRFYDLTQEVIDTYGAEFAAKAAIFARNELGMRSAAQFVSAILNNYAFDDKRKFYYTFCHRPDDVSEIFAAIDVLSDHYGVKQKRSHALVRGCGDYLSCLSNYGLSKYKLNGKKYNMYDLINITHAHSVAIDAYKNDELTVPDTWETAISACADEEQRNSEWRRLVVEKKLGYLALIRNLRNILNAAHGDMWIREHLIPQLTDAEKIHGSLVFPYQIYSAYKNMGSFNTYVVYALSEAFYIALDNMPRLDGDTLVMLDVSGSMDTPISARSNITIREAGAVYAMCILLMSDHSEFIKFGTHAAYYKPNKMFDNVFEEISRMQCNDHLGYGTDIAPAYQLVNRKYDRIMLISDMQIMSRMGYYSYFSREEAEGVTCYKEYCRAYGETPIYSFDLGNYPTQTDNPNNSNVHLCTSLSEKTLRLIALIEDGENIVDYINNNYTYR